MPWFEANETIRLASNTVVERGDLFNYPYHAGKALVAANRAEWSEPPDDRQRQATEPESDTPEADSEPADTETDDDSQGSEDEVTTDTTSVHVIDFTDITGIGGSSAKDMAEWVEEQGIETVAALLDEELTDMPHVGPSTVEDVREYLEELV